MLSNIFKVSGILCTLAGIVLFFAFVAPSKSTSHIQMGVIETPRTSVILENLIMNHSESVDDYENPQGACDED
jgi:hypothetical protein|tara:strand:+ start:1182 stop:1400 length:219 start_codon:yes stop_codon:yes gene_type:complete